ncbi:hypothetical protein ZIOFF_049945 [Zingiber officinale]|uniref:Uncharacterized protein n=1 Tax=Zingiber officinale TaxID=94328 RepID=A0A8J5FQS3_ZINOF|nr:hypothetical protein ZIOFF_049945 [Zingiber officinale]
MIPRFRVVEMLKSKRLWTVKCKFTTLLTFSDKKFVEKFVIPYKEEVPEVVKILEGQEGILLALHSGYFAFGLLLGLYANIPILQSLKCVAVDNFDCLCISMTVDIIEVEVIQRSDLWHSTCFLWELAYLSNSLIVVALYFDSAV